MSVQSRIKLIVLGAVAMVQPIILLAAAFGAQATPGQAASIQGVVGGIGVIVLAALGIQTQAK